MSDKIKLSIDNGVAEIVLNRPRQKNALELTHLAMLSEVLEDASKADIGCLVIRGEDGAFCAGRDLKGFDIETEDSYGFLARYANPVCHKIRSFSVPTIASIEGPCLGLGFGMAMAADISLASTDALIGSPFAKIGCVLDSGGHHALQERLGRHKAMELIVTGRLLSGTQAAEMGLINAAYSSGELAHETAKLARLIADGPRSAFRASKRILLDGESWDHMAEREACEQAKLMAGTDAPEGIKAFVEKRAAKFTER